MLDKIKTSLIYLMSAIQAAKIYTEEHPKFNDFCDWVFSKLQEVLKDRSEIIVGIVDDELAFEQEIFFHSGHKLKPLIVYLQDRAIERIVFHQGLQKEELVKFVSFLVNLQKGNLKDVTEQLSLLGIKNIRAGKIRALSAAQKKVGQNKSKNLTKESLDMVSSSLETVMDDEEINFLDLRFNILNVMENFMGMRQEIVDLASVKRKDMSTFLHLLNVTILSMYISSKLGFTKEDILDIGTAALFHDIGKLAISQKIIKKKSKLKEKEFSVMKDHSILGAKVLIKYRESLGILPVVVAFEHHLRYDLKGYPKLAFPKELHPASMIVSLCDVYDALAQRRTYKDDYPPLKIYDVMSVEKGKLFDPYLLDKFFRIMGVWPIGTIVSLDDGRIAVVREENEDKIFCPKIEVIHPKKQRESIDLKKVNGKIKIESSLNPFGEGQKYLRLV